MLESHFNQVKSLQDCYKPHILPAHYDVIFIEVKSLKFHQASVKCKLTLTKAFVEPSRTMEPFCKNS